MRMIAIAGLALGLLLGCKKDKDKDPCTYGTPSITPLSGGVGSSNFALDSVPRNSIPVRVNCQAGGSIGSFDDVHLTMLSVRLIATPSDSVMFAMDTVPNTVPNTDYFVYQETVGTDSITAPLAARLRVTATNTCGRSTEVFYDMMLMPN